jgi:hypothetical protein
MFRSAGLVLANVVLAVSCSTFYEVTHEYNTHVEEGNLDKALASLRNNAQYNKATLKFLNHVNNGLLLSLKGRYEESNAYFEKAFLFGEDYRVNAAREAASYFSNPNVTIYKGEDHEHLMVLYFKAMNFVKMQKYEEALVECRRLNIRLQQLSDRYSASHRYQRDAFIHTLMGIIYQANQDWNNAFIAYRNALETYETDYADMFQVSPPDQLKVDLLTCAWHSGFNEEYEQYKQQFQWPMFTIPQYTASLIFLWHNGLSPVKDEWSLTFAVNREAGDRFFISNQDMAMGYTYNVYDRDEQSELSDLEFFRVAVPRYVERPLYFTSALVETTEGQYPLHLAQDVNRVAFKCLQDRMSLELGKSLLRVALKKAIEHGLRKEDKGLGAVIGAINAATEKADTRNWQTLPHSIYYARIPLKEGPNETRFACTSVTNEVTENRFTYYAQKGQTLFHTFTSLEALPGYRY